MFTTTKFPWVKKDLAEWHKFKGYPCVRNYEQQQQLIDEMMKQHRPALYYGGFLEDRTQLWDGFEPTMDKMIHLGVDFELPVNHLLKAHVNCKVIHVLDDQTKWNGWGGRVILDCYKDDKFPFLLIGHLDGTYLPHVGTELMTGDVIGRVADGNYNGGWFPHIHVQQMSRMFIDLYENLNVVDGYDSKDQSRHLVDPTDLILHPS